MPSDNNVEIYLDITTPETVFEFTMDEIRSGGEQVDPKTRVIILPNTASWTTHPKSLRTIAPPPN